ncbi:hypothetical protein ACJX0J_010405 [Zea mays]
MAEEDVATFIQFVWSFLCITCYIVVLILHVATHIPSCTQNYDISIYFKIKLQIISKPVGKPCCNSLMHGVVGLIMGTVWSIVIVVNLINLGVLILLKMNLRGSVIIFAGKKALDLLMDMMNDDTEAHYFFLFYGDSPGGGGG